jgi:hypothetical protein
MSAMAIFHQPSETAFSASHRTDGHLSGWQIFSLFISAAPKYASCGSRDEVIAATG